MFESPDHFFQQALFIATGQSLQVKDMQLVGGGCISQAVRISTAAGEYFIKWSETADDAPMFETEARGLGLLRQTEALPIPQVVGQGQVEGKPFLLLEYLESSSPKKDYWQNLGQGLAALHDHTQESWGLSLNNFIGRLPQANEPMKDWIPFFVERRLEPQVSLAYYNQLIDKAFLERFRRLYPKLPDLLVSDSPALLHGDLWSGNVVTGPDGRAWIIDPAVYYGHREIELAFTKLFGGFDPAFYAAYEEVKPLEKGSEERFQLYNLYPLLVHVNLFGAGYLSGIERTLKRFL